MKRKYAYSIVLSLSEGKIHMKVDPHSSKLCCSRANCTCILISAHPCHIVRTLTLQLFGYGTRPAGKAEKFGGELLAIPPWDTILCLLSIYHSSYVFIPICLRPLLISQLALNWRRERE